MPTGSGKSLCYQLPALLRDDLTVVVSPLVALMQDQVEALAARGLGDRVALVNAQQDPGANAEALRQAAAGELRLLYVAPERFSSPGFLDAHARRAGSACSWSTRRTASRSGGTTSGPTTSAWRTPRVLWGPKAIVASTATATPRVATDVAARLRLRDPLHVATGFDRPNIAFAVARPTAGEKRLLLAEALRRPDALPAIVYAGTRAGAEEIADELTAALGEEALAYHAGLERSHRAAVQRSFLAGEVRVVVATNAFGMGVDKADVRTVIHASVPSSLEAYYQEAGRAGRDGRPALALLLAENRDKALHVHFIKREELDEGLPGWLADRLAAAADGEGRYSLQAAELVRGLGGDGDRLRALIGHLARAGVITPSPAPPDRVAGTIEGRFDRRADALCRSSIAEGARVRWRQYREVWAYVEEGGCRRERILRHFGDRSEPAASGPCCDSCGADLIPALPEIQHGSFESLDEAIFSIARGARPAVGRTTCAEILHGARNQKIKRNSYDGLPAYGSSAHMRRADILARVDELISEGRLATTGGPYPVLREAA